MQGDFEPQIDDLDPNKIKLHQCRFKLAREQTTHIVDDLGSLHQEVIALIFTRKVSNYDVKSIRDDLGLSHMKMTESLHANASIDERVRFLVDFEGDSAL